MHGLPTTRLIHITAVSTVVMRLQSITCLLEFNLATTTDTQHTDARPGLNPTSCGGVCVDFSYSSGHAQSWAVKHTPSSWKSLTTKSKHQYSDFRRGWQSRVPLFRPQRDFVQMGARRFDVCQRTFSLEHGLHPPYPRGLDMSFFGVIGVTMGVRVNNKFTSTFRQPFLRRLCEHDSSWGELFEECKSPPVSSVHELVML